MEIRKEEFDIITFKAGAKYFTTQKEVDEHYNFNSIDLNNFHLSEDELKTYFLYTDLKMPLGISRYGGNIIDIPKSKEFPFSRKNIGNSFSFIAQFDMSKISSYDKTGLLPKNGQLYFFDEKVIHIDIDSDELERIILKENYGGIEKGCLIEDFEYIRESFEDHLRELDEYDDFDDDEITSDGKVFDEFVGGQTSKFFGIFTDYQVPSIKEIEEMTFSNDMLLLQIGENGFNDEGVFYVSILKSDLKELNFSNCVCHWS